MNSLLRPFTGFVPAAAFAGRIVGPPSSMLTTEAKNASSDDELSFRHRVGRSAKAPYADAMAWLQRCRDLEALTPVEDAVIVHRLTHGDFSALGLLADLRVEGYADGRVKGHESTIEKTERKMLDYMQSTRIFGNPVALTHTDTAAATTLLASASSKTPDLVFESIAGTHHELWLVSGEDALALCASIPDPVYVTDGHHRLAAAVLLSATESLPDLHLPGAFYAENEQRLGTYSRALTDPTIDPDDVLIALRQRFALDEVAATVPRPSARQQLGLRLGGRSYVITVPDELVPSDTYGALDVNLLQDLLLGPLFGVDDPRTDARLKFVADTDDAAHAPDAFDAWFLPHAPSVSEVMAVADLGQSMPPKSTYFMPKVPSGLVIRTIDSGDSR